MSSSVNMQLSVACELLKTASPDAQLGDGTTAVTFLYGMLRHDSPVVREGALYGLEGHMRHAEVANQVTMVANYDSSPSVRAAARTIAYDFANSSRMENPVPGECGVWHDRYNRCHLSQGHGHEYHEDGDRCRWRKGPNDLVVRPQRQYQRLSCVEAAAAEVDRREGREG